jgi:hypothetical protein
MDLGDAARLFAGKGGERWLVHAREGTAEAAPLLADEDLVAITKPDPNTFAFIGSGGSIYVSQTPLGPFVDVRHMEPAPLRVAAAGKSIVALHWDGSVTRSIDAGRTFATVPVGGSQPFDVALSPDGRAVILGYPEQLWISRDDAATWSQASTPTVGAGFVGMDANGSLVSRGLRASIVWSSEERSVPVVADRALEVPPLDLLTDLEPGPSASALAAGRAVLTGTTYFEVARQEDEGPWYLASGELTERIHWMPIPQSDECKHMAIGANGRRIVLGCMSGARRGGVLFPSLRVIVSRDGGSTFTPKRPTVLVADEEGVSLTILGDDTLIVTGACKPDPRGICSPSAPMRLIPSSESRTLQFESTEPAKLPVIVGRVGRVHVGPGAERLYAKAQLSSGPALLISEDRGESFRAIPLDLSKTAVASKHDVPALFRQMQPGKLVVGRDGTLSWVLYTEPGPIWVLLSDRGKVLSAHLAPEGQPFLEVAGRNGIAFGNEEGALVESSDGGATFEPLTRLPTAMLQSEEEAPTIWCDLGGCVFGDSFSRIGWGAKNGGILAPKKSGDVAKPEKPSFRTPIVCELIESASGEIQNVVDFPDAADAQRGSVAWSALVVDPKTASVQVARATASPNHAVSLATLFAPTRNPARVALDARSQAEGAAALRYTFAVGADGKPTVGSPLRRVEVAWDNQFEGAPQRATIAVAGTLRPGDVSPRGTGVAAQANVEMLSVAPGGIHVCPHGACDQPGDQILFLRGRGPVDTIPIPPWPERALGGGAIPLSRHVMHVLGKQVPIAIHQNFSIILRAERHEDGSYAFPALGLAPWNSKELGLGQVTYWAYLASGMMGLSQTVYHPTEDLAYARVMRFDTDQGVAKAVPAPTQRSLSDPPVACTTEKKDSFRVPSPALRGTQHPVIIDHGRMKELLHTQLAVLYGSPSAACVDVIDARSEESTHRRALIPLGAMDRSWLLSRQSNSLQWYGMRCRFDPGAKVEGGNVGSPPPPAPAPAGNKRPATAADCEFIFDKIIGFMGVTMPPAALNPARDAFKVSCQGRSVDMDCVRNATDHNQIMTTCLSLP